MNGATPIRVGIVGANAERGWARDAHLDALRALSSTFTISAVSARDLTQAAAAAEYFGAQLAFGDSRELVRSRDVDVVVVAVKVPEHRSVVLAALDAGKHVYCEWPLGRTTAEAVELLALTANWGPPTEAEGWCWWRRSRSGRSRPPEAPAKQP